MPTTSQRKPLKERNSSVDDQKQGEQECTATLDEQTMTVEQYLLEKCSESVRELHQCAEKLNEELQVDAESCKKKIREIVEQL